MSYGNNIFPNGNSGFDVDMPSIVSQSWIDPSIAQGAGALPVNPVLLQFSNCE